jgi:hypothetical protein
MSHPRLTDLFCLNRRYSRSVNLERDWDQPGSIEGYIPTTRSIDALRRILSGFQGISPQHAWTLTGVYGTGKSAFAHYLMALVGAKNHPLRQSALQITIGALGADSSEVQYLQDIPPHGFFRAVAVGQREPLERTLIRALEQGASHFWTPKQRASMDVTRRLVDLVTSDSHKVDILSLTKEIVTVAQVPIIFIIDELGKNLEYAAQHEGASDLYLLQRLAELNTIKVGKESYPVFILGLLHQGFSDYGQRLASIQRNEWDKIQGRFEEIPFTESTEQMMHLMAQVIQPTATYEIIAEQVTKQSNSWLDVISDVPGHLLSQLYPLHPLTALVLPVLCTRYAQNDRSLFTFLTSEEPFAFRQFLKQEIDPASILLTLQLPWLYDYFVESFGAGMSSRPNMQRWLEVQELIATARSLEGDWVKVLKTIGILNLVASSGLRASPEWVALALCDSPNELQKIQYWRQIIEQLQEKGLVTYRRTLNELRLWQGSDFDVEKEISQRLPASQHLTDLLREFCPLKPVIAQRHSYLTGTLRYFERRYLDKKDDLHRLTVSTETDGLLGYWLDTSLPATIPAVTSDGKPLVMVTPNNLDKLKIYAEEYEALRQIQGLPELQRDGVAKLEVRHRLVQIRQLLDEAMSQAFDVTQATCFLAGQVQLISSWREFNSRLSDLCDQAYDRGLRVWNELINRRELTAQGATARAKLLTAMLENGTLPRLGLTGHGPEVSMYESLLSATGIHREVAECWGFYPPLDENVLPVWQSIEEFCMQAHEHQCTLDGLYLKLALPPYGVKRGAIPILLAAVLLNHADDVSVYKDGTFIPVLGTEHFELLVKDPSRFAVKYFQIAGVRAQVFQELENILRSKAPSVQGIRNVTLLSVVKPLFQFVKKLPACTKNTKRLSQSSQQVLATLLQAQEPDELLFNSLPSALGLPVISSSAQDDGSTAKIFRQKLVQSLHEIQVYYENLLQECQQLLYNAFGIRSETIKLREDLRVRASHLVGQVLEPRLKSFVLAAVDEHKPDREWLESVLMIVADKPVQSWSDADVTQFEIKLSDLARRFQNLEALQADVRATRKEGFAARRVTVTHPDGHEIHRMVWMDDGMEAKIQPLIDQVLQQCREPQLQQALVTQLIETIFGKVTNEDQLADKKRKIRADKVRESHLK